MKWLFSIILMLSVNGCEQMAKDAVSYESHIPIPTATSTNTSTESTYDVVTIYTYHKVVDDEVRAWILNNPRSRIVSSWSCPSELSMVSVSFITTSVR